MKKHYKRSDSWSQLELEYLSKNKHHPISQLAIYMAKTNTDIKRKIAELDGKPIAHISTNKKSKIGRRKDLNNQFFRSSWEANSYRALLTDPQVKSIEYEPYTFSFAPFGILKGTVSYTPDFKVNLHSGDYFWIEIKGQTKREDQTKIKRFIKYYPEEASKLKAIVGSTKTKSYEFFCKVDIPIYNFYNDINKKYRKIIPHWE